MDNKSLKIGAVIGVVALVCLLAGVWIGASSRSSVFGKLVEPLVQQFPNGIVVGTNASWDSTGAYTGTAGTFSGAVSAGTLTVGSGDSISKIISKTATWNPGSVNDGAVASTTAAVAGAVAGNPCFVGLSSATSSDAYILGCVIDSSGQATVTLFNKTGVALDLATGTLRLNVFQH